MIISIILPSNIHARNQVKRGIFRSKLYFKKNRLVKKSIVDKSNIVYKGNSILMCFDSKNACEVQKLRQWTAEICAGLMVGVDHKNPITTDLPGVKEVII